MGKVPVAALTAMLAEFAVFSLALGRHAEGMQQVCAGLRHHHTHTTQAEEDISKELAALAIDKRVTVEQWLQATINKQALLVILGLSMETFNSLHIHEGKHLVRI